MWIVSSKQVAAEKAKAEAEKDLDPWFSEAEAEDNTVCPKPRWPLTHFGALFLCTDGRTLHVAVFILCKRIMTQVKECH